MRSGMRGFQAAVLAALVGSGLWIGSVHAQAASAPASSKVTPGQAVPALAPSAVSESADSTAKATRDFEEKERGLKAKLAQDATDYQAAEDLGNLYYDQGKREDAEASYRQAIKIKPDFVPALVNLGVVLNEGAKSDDAVKYFDQALALKPNDITALCNKGQALYALRKYAEAVGLYLQAIKDDDKSQLAHYWLGVAFADAGIYREAILEWQKVVAIDPKTDNASTAKEGIDVLQQLLKEH